MTTKLEQAARQALEALEALNPYPASKENQRFDAITALREALAEQAEQEPVAWRVRGYNQFKTGNPAPWRYVDGTDKPTVNIPDCCDFEPLYAAPVRTKDMTEDEIFAFDNKAEIEPLAFARAVIAADREKNRG